MSIVRPPPEREPRAILCDVSEVADADARVVEALARLQLCARRIGCRIELRGARDDLLALLELMGVRDALVAAEEEASG